MGSVAMSQWCAACLQDETRVSAARSVANVPLCIGCASVFSDDPTALANMRIWLNKNAATESVVADNFEPFYEQKCACGCGTTVPLGHKLVTGHSPKVVPAAPSCKCGKELGHTGRCTGHPKSFAKELATPRETPQILAPGAINVGGLAVKFMPTKEYISQFGAIHSKGMKRETMELWEQITALSYEQCMIVSVPNDKEPFKMRSQLSNTIQRLVRVNKPEFRIVLGANNTKRHIVICKEKAR